MATTTIRLATSVADSQQASEDLMRVHRQAKGQRQRDEKLLNDVRESAIARRLFHGLDPTACPRCDQDIAAERRQLEIEAHSCDAYRPRYVVDLRRVTFMDSTGINLLIAAHQTVTAAGGWLRLAGPQQAVLRTLQIVGADDVIDCRSTLREAISP